jgi:hypothetical protein
MRGIALTAGVVLAAIAVGVGVEAAVAPPVYGPPGAQFTAQFPATPVEQTAAVATLKIYRISAGSRDEQLSVISTVTDLRALQRGRGYYSPVTFSAPVAASSSVGIYRPSRHTRPLAGPMPPPSPAAVRAVTLAGDKNPIDVQCGRAPQARRSTCAAWEIIPLTRTRYELVTVTVSAVAHSATSALALLSSVRSAEAG